MAEKLSKQVENTVGKGEIARYEQFLLFSQCFQKTCFQGVSKGVIVWKWVNPAKPVVDAMLTVYILPSMYSMSKNKLASSKKEAREGQRQYFEIVFWL